jgi:cyclopropane-fatty-acyl-phospholipid synthase
MTSPPGASQQAIEHHYDVGNDFYALWLDETRSYSCALWDAAQGLDEAQLAKIDLHVRQARAAGCARVLDIGCGWGATLRRLVETHGVRQAVGLTLSRQQAAHVAAQAWPAVAVAVEGWADHAPAEPYDALISVGAFEHFARLGAKEEEKIDGYRAFFRRCHGWLRPGGYLSLQTICYENARREDFSPFFAEQIFPESDLPRPSEIFAASERLFEVVTLRNDREDYARTAREWLRRLRARRAEAIALVGEEVTRRYEMYLKMLTIGFHVGTMGLMRIAFRRIERPRP